MKTKLKHYFDEAWFPIAGWSLALGFIINCVLAPYLEITTVNWVLLVTLLALLLAWKGTQDCKIQGCKCGNKDFPRYWIVVIGWALCLGFLNNAVVNQFYAINTIDWIEMLTALAALIGIGTGREMKLKKISEKYTGKQMWIVHTGIMLSLGIFVICFIAPVLNFFMPSWTPIEIDWYYLIAGLAVVGGNEGVRKLFLAKAEARTTALKDSVQAKVEEAPDKITEKDE